MTTVPLCTFIVMMVSLDLMLYLYMYVSEVNPFLKFFHVILSRKNDCLSLFTKLALNGSGSIICQNLNLVSYIYSLNKYQMQI